MVVLETEPIVHSDFASVGSDLHRGQFGPIWGLEKRMEQGLARVNSPEAEPLCIHLGLQV